MARQPAFAVHISLTVSLKNVYSDLAERLLGFPEIWEALAQRDWNRDQLPRVWSRGDSWKLWNPPEGLYESMWKLDAKTSGRLSELTRGSCRLARQVSSDGSWLHLIQTHEVIEEFAYSARIPFAGGS